MTYILKYAWLAILIILYVIWTVHVIIELKDDGIDCFDDDLPCTLWIVSTILVIFFTSLIYFALNLKSC